jgi:hypothetical protein
MFMIADNNSSQASGKSHFGPHGARNSAGNAPKISCVGIGKFRGFHKINCKNCQPIALRPKMMNSSKREKQPGTFHRQQTPDSALFRVPDFYQAPPPID